MMELCTIYGWRMDEHSLLDSPELAEVKVLLYLWQVGQLRGHTFVTIETMDFIFSLDLTIKCVIDFILLS